jgi:hypothetical protein
MTLPFFMQVQENSSPGTAFRRRYMRSRRFCLYEDPTSAAHGTLHAVTASSTGPVYQKTWGYRERCSDVHTRQLLSVSMYVLGYAVTYQQAWSPSRSGEGKYPCQTHAFVLLSVKTACYRQKDRPCASISSIGVPLSDVYH